MVSVDRKLVSSTGEIVSDPFLESRSGWGILEYAIVPWASYYWKQGKPLWLLVDHANALPMVGIHIPSERRRCSDGHYDAPDYKYCR